MNSINDVAIIGLDAKFADADNIDRFERLCYLGSAVDNLALSESEKDSVSLITRSVDTLCQANGLNAEQIELFVLSNSLGQVAEAKLAKQYASINVVSSLAASLPVIKQRLSEQAIVALVGLELAEVTVQERASLSFEAGFSQYGQSEGVASLLLASAAKTSEINAYTYATIKGLGIDKDVSIACHKAIDESLIQASDIKLLEVSALADSNRAADEAEGLTKAYRSDRTLQTAISGLRSITGEAACFSQVAGLVRAVLALHQRYFPGINDWEKPSELLWQNSPFYFPVESRPCFPNSNGKSLYAAYSCMTADDYVHIILEENQAEEERYNGFIACGDLVMIPVAAVNEAAFIQALETLETSVQSVVAKSGFRQFARDAYETFKQSDALLKLCLLAESKEELLKEIQLAKEGVKQVLADGGEWKTPKGSFFTADAVADAHDVAFLYPGIGATYVGLGRDIFHLFPEIYQPVAKLADDIGASLKDELLNPRSIVKLGFKDIKALDHELRNSLANIAECGVGFACVFTKIFEEVFKVNADFATGYSMGEISMYAALGCWEKPGLMSERLANSDTFNHRLTGELQTLRQHWDLPPAKEGEIEQLWETYTLKATAEEIAEASVDEDRVYCTIINTPDSLVIGGYPEACQRVIKKLGVRAMPLDMPNAIHSAPAFKEYEHMEALYTMDVTDRIPTKLYSSSCYLPVPQRTKAIANSIAKCLCDPVDFPRLINSMYDKGARVFIEMGPGRSLCSWIDKILKHDEVKPHVSVPVNAKGTSDELTILRAIAKLVSHGVNVDLEKIYYGSLVTPAGAASTSVALNN